MINPAEIPTLEHVDAEAVITAGKKIRHAGDEIADAGADVYKAWQGLAHCYEAPEAATFEVKTAKTGAALVTYGHAVGPIKKRLASLKAEATAFVARMKALGEEWRADPANVEQDRRLQAEVTKAVRAFMEAEQDCAKAINAASGSAAPPPRQLPKPGQATPWGSPEQVDVPWYEDVWNAVKGFGAGFAVDGAGGTIVGLGAMVGLGEDGDFARAMLGLSDLAVLTPGGAALPDVGHLAIGDAGTGVPTSRNERLQMMGKGFLAWDKWKTDPARAAGEAAFNVITLPFVGTKIGTAGKLGSLAAATNKATAVAARVGYIADVPSHIIRLGAKGTGAAIKGIANLGDLGRAGKIPDPGDLGKIDLPDEAGKAGARADATPPAATARHADLPTRAETTARQPTVREVIDEIGERYEGGFAIRDVGRLAHPADDVSVRPGGEPAAVGGGRGTAPFGRFGNEGGSPRMAGDDGASRSPAGSGGLSDAGYTPRSTLRFDHTSGADLSGRADAAPGRGITGSAKDEPFGSEGFAPNRPGGDLDAGFGDGTPATGKAATTDGEVRSANAGDGSGDVPTRPPEDAGLERLPEAESGEKSGWGDPSSVSATPLERHAPLPSPDDLSLVLGADGLIETVNGQPVGDFIDDLTARRAQDYVDLRRSRSSPEFSQRKVGPVLSVLMDLRTGRLYEGVNTLLKSPGQLHPVLRERLDRYERWARENGPFDLGGQTGRRPWLHFSQPGRHAEVAAVNKALLERAARGEVITEGSLKELMFDNRQLRGGLKDAPCCANCSHILYGMPNRAGYFDRYPPGDRLNDFRPPYAI